MLILRAEEMFELGANVNVEKVKLWCSTLCPPAPTPANQIVSNQTYQITLGTLFYLCDLWPRQRVWWHDGDSCSRTRHLTRH